MSRRTINRRALLGGALASIVLAEAPAFARQVGSTATARVQRSVGRPNIVVILADDMGFSDIGAYGSEIPTPNIDALAARGLRFTQFYNSARCSPSRASLLTGLYPHQAGMGGLDDVVRPQSRGLHGRLLDRAVTIPQVLRDAGYFTAMAGKWHMGQRNGTPPASKGFDRSFLMPGSTHFRDQRPNAKVVIDGREVPFGSPEVGTGNWYVSDLLADWSARFIAEAKAEAKPFFLYLPFTAPHFPVMAPPEDIARFRHKYLAGWDKLREARLARQKRIGIVGVKAALPPLLAENYDWNELSAADKDRFDEIMAVYAAAVHRMDAAVGKLVAGLKASGKFDNTLILFMTDNGGNAESGPDGRLVGEKPGDARSAVWVGLNWATLQNTPLSYFKHYGEEGGVATPLVVHWPRGIDPALNGGLVHAPGHVVDVMATLVDVTGATYPTTFEGAAILPMEGRSMTPSFSGKALKREVPLFFEHEGNRSVRHGRWKLVARFQEPWRLYDIDADRGEASDLARRHPDVVARMSGEWDAWAARAFVDAWDRKDRGGVVRGSLEGGPPRAGAGLRPR